LGLHAWKEGQPFLKANTLFLLNLMLGLLAKKGEVSYRNTIPDSNSGTFLTIYIYIVYHFLLHLPAERFQRDTMLHFLAGCLE
jgi:hypothetical protein